MVVIILIIFCIGYAGIAFEHQSGIDKSVAALIMAGLMWVIITAGFYGGYLNVIDSTGHVFSYLSGDELADDGFHNISLHHLANTASILVFLLGAMTIVELIDLHRGFNVIRSQIKTRKKRSLLVIIGVLAFVLSAIIDNLTATIVLCTLIVKIFENKNDKMMYGGMVVIAANAGGAWSPVGDVTTTMLWVENLVTAQGLIMNLIIPSVICFTVPFLAASFTKVFKGEISEVNSSKDESYLLSSKKMLIVGIFAILSVPLLKIFLHVSPYISMMLALGTVWLISERVHPEEDFTAEKKVLYKAKISLSRVHWSEILFFLGILMGVAGLETIVFGEANGESVHTLRYLAEFLQDNISSQEVVILLLGTFSAIVDNVPLVAASMGMYDWPTDSTLWHLLAYSAGTGGSMLIIGSAAGVAAMGLLNIPFGWYLKKIAPYAVLGFISGAIWIILIN